MQITKEYTKSLWQLGQLAITMNRNQSLQSFDQPTSMDAMILAKIHWQFINAANDPTTNWSTDDRCKLHSQTHTAICYIFLYPAHSCTIYIISNDNTVKMEFPFSSIVE